MDCRANVSRPTQTRGSLGLLCSVNQQKLEGAQEMQSLSLSEVEDISSFCGFQPAPIACKVRTLYFERKRQKYTP